VIAAAIGESNGRFKGATTVWIERVFNVQRWTRMPRGGHFAAMETPRELAEEIQAFFGSIS
jgi:hypothetical protein